MIGFVHTINRSLGTRWVDVEYFGLGFERVVALLPEFYQVSFIFRQ